MFLKCFFLIADTSIPLHSTVYKQSSIERLDQNHDTFYLKTILLNTEMYNFSHDETNIINYIPESVPFYMKKCNGFLSGWPLKQAYLS